MKKFILSQPEQWVALSSEVRLQIVDLLEADGPRSVAEIAAEVGKTPHALYHHFRKLEQVGIIQIDHTRRSGSREEAVYDVCGRPVVLRLAPDTEATRAMKVKSARKLLRQAERNYEAAMRAAPKDSRPEAQPELRHHLARLHPPSVRKIEQHLNAIYELMTQERVPAAEATPDTKRYSWMTLLTSIPDGDRDSTD